VPLSSQRLLLPAVAEGGLLPAVAGGLLPAADILACAAPSELPGNCSCSTCRKTV